MSTPVIRQLDHRLGTLAEKREQKREPLPVPVWFVFLAFICGGMFAIVPGVAIGYHYAEQDLERAAYRAGVGQYVTDPDGKREFYFISDKNQYPARPHRPDFLK